MLSAIKAWLASRKWPVDPRFKSRPRHPSVFGDWVIVEMGANEYVLVSDALHNIVNSADEHDHKSRRIMALRLQCLAMSIRTHRGRIPFNWQRLEHLQELGLLPITTINTMLDCVAELSELPWLKSQKSKPSNELVTGSELEKINP